ncbi:MAG: hypothetical protein CMC35_06180 [Flavobacteriaceae bacterium]|nr:hypothetical protein [Flavobacteriaceae bacterium]|tara:strand:- start:8723 stop:9562 length:840 start_codon:yes stop_codon:yes gene_type:complete
MKTLHYTICIFLLFGLLACSNDETVVADTTSEANDEMNDETAQDVRAFFIESVTGGIVSRNYSYDANGRLMMVTTHDQEYQFEYTAEGQLDGILLLHTFEYDNGDLISYAKYDVELYTDAQFIATHNVYNGADELISFETRWELLFEGSLFKEIHLMTSTGNDYAHVFVHDAQGRLLQIDNTNNDDYVDTWLDVADWDPEPVPHMISTFYAVEAPILFPDKFISMYGLKTVIGNDGLVHDFEYDFSTLEEGYYTSTRTLPHREDDYVVRFGRKEIDLNQ